MKKFKNSQTTCSDLNVLTIQSAMPHYEAKKTKRNQVKGVLALTTMFLLVSCYPPQTAIPAPPASIAPTAVPTAVPTAAPTAAPTAVPIVDDSDKTAPTVSSTVPVSASTDVALNLKQTVTFSEPMDPLTMTPATFSLTGPGATPVAGSVTYVGVTASFTPNTALKPNTVYTGRVNTGSRDLAGNALASDFVWTFTTGARPDVTAPTVSSTVPVNASTNVALNLKPSVTFSEPMDPLTITPATFSLSGPGATPVAGSVTYVGVIASFAPNSALKPNTLYTGRVTTGASDLAGNALASEYTWQFTTGAEIDTSAPTVIATTQSTVPIGSNIFATFSEAMDPFTASTNTFKLRRSDSGSPVFGAVTYVDNTATFRPFDSLSTSTEYIGTLTTGFEDLAGNALAKEYVWTFVTESATGSGSNPTPTPTPDITAPTVSSNTPLNAATDISITVEPTATFSEAMDPLSITSNFSLKKGINTILGTVSYLGTKATFKPTVSLDPNTEYTATIKGGSSGVKDPSQNPLATDFVWTFKTIADPIVHLGPATVNLGNTGPYGVLSNTSVTLGGAGRRVNGDVGIFPAGACNGCDATTVSGVIAIGAAAEPAMTSLQSAYDDAISRADSKCTLIDSGNLTTNPPPLCLGTSNGVFAPGLYWSSSSIAIPAGGTITLDGKNDPSSVFIFQSESTINTIGGNTHIILINQAKAKNVFWVAKSSATIGGTTSDFAGTVLALVAVTVNTGTQMSGRALARGAAVTVQDNAVITVPSP